MSAMSFPQIQISDGKFSESSTASAREAGGRSKNTAVFSMSSHFRSVSRQRCLLPKSQTHGLNGISMWVWRLREVKAVSIATGAQVSLQSGTAGLTFSDAVELAPSLELLAEIVKT